MLKDIIEARPLGQHRLHLRLEDGAEGEVDIATMLDFTRILAPLGDPTYFAQVTTNPESGAITWPNGTDLDPDVLYAAVTEFFAEQRLASAKASRNDHTFPLCSK